MKRNKLVFSSLVLLTFGTGVAIAGSLYQARAIEKDLKAHPAPGRMVEADGLKYHLNCIGTGSPAVILEAGLGESSLSWHPVHAKLAESTRVCAYDRAGLGWSEGTGKPMSPEQVAANLHQLLQHAAIPSPFVLVGHSRGGLFARSYYHLFPDQVQGIVLVDSVHDNVPAREFSYAKWAYFKQRIQIAIARPLSRIGFIRMMGWADADRHPSPLPANILAAKTAVQNRTDTTRAVVNEISVMRKSLDPSMPPPSSLGKLPLVVLTSGKLIDLALARRDAAAANRSIEDAVAMASIHRISQQELAALSSNSKHVIAEKSGHFVMYDQPELVVKAVFELLETVRHGKS